MAGWLPPQGDNTVIVWDLESGQSAQTLQGHTDVVWSVAWSVEGRLASGSRDKTVIVWDPSTSVRQAHDTALSSGLESGQPAKTLQGHTDFVNSVAWSRDGRLASASDDNTIIVWDLESGQPAQILLGHTS